MVMLPIIELYQFYMAFSNKLIPINTTKYQINLKSITKRTQINHPPHRQTFSKNNLTNVTMSLTTHR